MPTLAAEDLNISPVNVPVVSMWSPTVLVPEQSHVEVPALLQFTSLGLIHAQPMPTPTRFILVPQSVLSHFGSLLLFSYFPLWEAETPCQCT